MFFILIFYLYKIKLRSLENKINEIFLTLLYKAYIKQYTTKLSKIEYNILGTISFK